MRRSGLLTMALVAVWTAGVVPAATQSLADVAKKEEERRKEIKDPSKVLTNKDLAPAPPGMPPAADAGSAASKPADAADAKGADAKDSTAKDAKDKDAKDKDAKEKDAKGKEPVKDQKYWSDRQRALQDALSRDQTYSDALQSRVNALVRDFVNEADPVKQRIIGADRQKALDELDRLKKQIVDDKKAMADFEEEARRAGVPPGWLR